MTAHAMKGDREKCLDAGMDDYITEPVSLDRIQELVTRWKTPTRPHAARHNGVQITEATTSNPVSPEDAPMNIAQALDALGGEQELSRQVLLSFVQTLPALLVEIQGAYARSDAPRLEAAAQNLRGSAANICAEPVREISQRLEAFGRQSRLEDAAAVLPELKDRLDRLQAFVTGWLKEADTP